MPLDGLRGGFKTPLGGGKKGSNEKVVWTTAHVATVGAGLTRYIWIGDQTGEYYAVIIGAAAVRGDTIYMCTQSGTVNNLVALAEAAAGVGQSFTYTLFRNGVATALTCAISGAVQVTNSDLVNSVAVNAGDWLALQLVTSAAAASTYHTISMRVSVPNNREKWNSGTAANSVGAGLTRYMYSGFRGFVPASSTAVEGDIRADTNVTKAGTLRNLVVRSIVAPGAGQSFTYTIRINQVPTAITCTISGAVQTLAQDLVNTAAVIPGDRVTVEIVTSAAAVACAHNLCYEWR